MIHSHFLMEYWRQGWWHWRYNPYPISRTTIPNETKWDQMKAINFQQNSNATDWQRSVAACVVHWTTCNLLNSNYLNFVSFSKCFIKLSLAVWWSTMVTLWLWNECKTAIFASTSALSFHSDVGVRVSKSIFIAIFYRLKRTTYTGGRVKWEWRIWIALFNTHTN